MDGCDGFRGQAIKTQIKKIWARILLVIKYVVNKFLVDD